MPVSSYERTLALPLFLAILWFLSTESPAQSPFADSAEDWLVRPAGTPVEVHAHPDRDEIELSNGLVRRTFRIAPNAATISFDNLITGAPVIRAVKPEARLQLNGVWYDVGGLVGQPNGAYLTEEWIAGLQADSTSFRYVGYETSEPVAHIAWKQVRYAAHTTWPPKGKVLTLRFEPPIHALPVLEGLMLQVHYQMLQDLPALLKWITVTNGTKETVVLDRFVSEVLGVVEAESAVDTREHWRQPPILVGSDYAFRGMDATTASQTTRWSPDPDYLTQVNYARLSPVLLESVPPIGPDAHLAPGDTFESYRTFELLFDSDDRERRGLAIRRLLRTIAPWLTENPIFMHVRQADPASVRRAIDQAADVGFEMVILTFGSGFDMENTDPAYLAEIKSLVDYAHSKGIELGGYSLLASRRISDAHDVINPETGTTGGATFGNSPCLGSTWGRAYFQKLTTFFEQTGLDLLEHDGSYPGDVCAATHHPGHRGLLDSQWTQWRTVTEFYAWCRARGIYLNVPDYYFLNGSNKTGMGYRETNWSLPRDQQIIHARQNIFDGTWEKTPSMGWMFVPLVEYHGGGAAATLEPLSEHLETYEAHLANLFGAGVMAAYRGPRLYDTEATRAVVKRWVDFYRAHRPILDSDLIHLRRADGRDIDGWLHVNPNLPEKGLAVFYNPTDREIEKVVTLPLYYTGLRDTARIREREETARSYELDRAYRVALPVEMAPRSVTWFVIEHVE